MKWLEKYKTIQPKLEKESDYPHWAISSTSTLLNQTGTWRIFRPIYQNKIPPCNNECPTNEKIQAYCDLLKHHKIADAYKIILEDNPFPSITGRVCYHPCENKCNRKDFDDAILIHAIEKFIGDWGLKNVPFAKRQANKEQTVAIVGGGPAAMSASYYLAQAGYQVTIFEKQAKLGGMLRYGIPSYRLPKKVLDQELQKLTKLGVKTKTKCTVGKEISIDELTKTYNYVIVCYGAHKNRPLGVPNDNAQGIISGLEFLHQINSGKKPNIGKKVAIIGGGNTAIDAARSCLRLGRKPIILYRRTRNEMPAVPDEINACENEGIKIEFLVAPHKVHVNKKGKITALELIRMKLGPPDASGRRKPVPIANSNFKMKLDTIITAIGEQVDLSIVPDYLDKNDWGIKADFVGKTNINNLFAIGDCVTGPRTVVEAFGAGKRVAFTIIGKIEKITHKSDNPVKFSDLNLDYFEHLNKTDVPELPIATRKTNFKEVHLGYNQVMAIKEASRCFSCGVCNKCDNCFVFCPDLSVLKENDEYAFDYDFCKGCGVCAHECPRSAITMIEESKMEE